MKKVAEPIERARLLRITSWSKSGTPGGDVGADDALALYDADKNLIHINEDVYRTLTPRGKIIVERWDQPLLTLSMLDWWTVYLPIVATSGAHS